MTLIFQNRKRNQNPTTRSYFFVQLKVVGFKTTFTLLNHWRWAWRTGSVHQQTSYNLPTHTTRPAVNYWVRSNNSNSGDFPEAARGTGQSRDPKKQGDHARPQPAHAQSLLSWLHGSTLSMISINLDFPGRGGQTPMICTFKSLS